MDLDVTKTLRFVPRRHPEIVATNKASAKGVMAQIGSMEAMIAGHAMAIGAVLVTNNGRHFSRVAGLAVKNWLQDH